MASTFEGNDVRSTRARTMRRWPVVLASVGGLAIFALLVLLPIPWQDQAALGATMFAVALVLHRASRSQRVTLALVLLSVFCSTRYFLWRLVETWRYWSVRGADGFELDLVFVVLLLAAEAYTFVILMLGYFQGIRPLGRRPAPLPADPREWPTVDVFIPTYNEPLDVVRPTVLAAQSIDWPADRLRIHLLDDGRRVEFRDFAERARVGYFTRADNQHAKAGNINHALAKTDAELIVVFDCDHIPTRSFLQMTVGWFLRDARLGMLQTPHHFYSADPFERNLETFRRVPNEGSLFYGVVQDGNDLWNATFFCGSAAVLRRSALGDVGGVAVETVTEDAHTSLRLQRKGWGSAYINMPLIGGLATATISDHITQRIRWARGMVQILRRENPLFASGLSFAQRLCYFNCMIHFLYSLPRLVFLTSPLIFLLLERNNLYGYVFAILAYGFPHLMLAMLTNSRIQRRFRHSFWNEVYECVLSPYILLPTLAALINPRWGKFNVTPKARSVAESYLDWRVASPFLILLALNFAGVVTGIRRLLGETEMFGPIFVNVLWAAVNILTLGAAVAACYERRQLRRTNRVAVSRPAAIVCDRREVAPVETRDLSVGGAALACAEPLNLRPGDPIGVILDHGSAPLPSKVAAVKGGLIRVEFADLSLEQHRQVTQILFGRADAWLNWNDGCEPDRPLRSFLRIAKLALRGIGLLAAQPVMAVRKLSRVVVTPRRRFAMPMLLLLIGGLLFFALRASAQSSKTPLPVFHDSIDVGRPGQRDAMALRGVNGRASFQFSLPLTKVALKARLVLQYTPSARLEAGASAIQISLNGTAVATTPLQHGSPVETEVELPGDLFMNDNTLQFALNGRCPSCSASAGAELRTWIEPSSRVEVTGNVLPVPNDTRLLPAPFFDPSHRQEVALSFYFPAQPNAEVLEAAGVVASWLGGLADTRRLRFRPSIGRIPAGNVAAFVQPGSEAAAQFGVADAKGPAIALRDNPADPSGKALVLIGKTPAEMKSAAVVLATGSITEQGDFVRVGTTPSLAGRMPYDAPRWAASDGVIGLISEKPLSQHTSYGDGVVRVYFRLPPDLYFGVRTSAPLGVAFRCSDLGNRQALVQIRMNGLLVGSIRVKPEQSDEIITRVLAAPIASLYARNTLSMEFIPEVTGGDSIVPKATLLSGTWLDLRGLPHFARMPRVDLFARAGFPFTRMADLSETAFVLPARPSNPEIGLYLEVAGFLAAQTGYPGLQLTVTNHDDVARFRDKDLLVIGGPGDQPLLARWAASMPLLVDRGGFAIPGHRNAMEQLLTPPWTSRGRARAALERDLRRGDGADSAIVGFASPLSESRSVVAIALLKPPAAGDIVDSLTAADSAAISESGVLLPVNGSLRGYAVAGAITHSGHLSWHEAFNYWTHQYLAAVPIVVVAGMLLVASGLRRHLERRASQRVEAA